MEIMELVDNRPQSHRFNCDWKTCNKGFKRKSDLQRHYRIHTNDRPFPCPAPGCESSFIQRSALTVHLRIHTGEKPYECQYPGCDKRFADSSSFSRHRRLHVGKRPYTCAVATCRKHFVRKVAMVQHHKLHHRTNDDSKEFTDQCWNSSPRHDEVAATSTAVMMPPRVDAASRESPRAAGHISSTELHSHDRAGVAERFAESPLANSYRQPYGRVHYDYSTADGQFFYDDSHSSQGSEQASSPIDDFASQQLRQPQSFQTSRLVGPGAAQNPGLHAGYRRREPARIRTVIRIACMAAGTRGGLKVASSLFKTSWLS
ncbi:Zinc finger protein 143 [Colletotrichum aenigma]|uniref:Zinc finger protein 143 n=1 Tax=Colletotrichum aenigma TaxID=1215731 RepID=UPI001872656D|nr:Zinc finger protein 143 [Colletotrichum aenigma]KAF5527528.1 Zinc finger protein 143 [Colletotrichum aenigma]